ncbi:Putative ribonuclease H protein At1g65750 [Linum grandiflorum]
MQTVVLPATICQNIDKRVCSFIWGSCQGEKKMHLIDWDTICQPKELGGLDIRSAQEMNEAYMVKLVWGMFTHPDELWAQVLGTKYMLTVGGRLVPRGTKRATRL